MATPSFLYMELEVLEVLSYFYPNIDHFYSWCRLKRDRFKYLHPAKESKAAKEVDKKGEGGGVN